MPELYFVSSNSDLRHAVVEQLPLAGAWQVIEVPSVATLLSQWDAKPPQAILMEDAVLQQAAKQMATLAEKIIAGVPPAQLLPLVFVIGEPGDALALNLLTEIFPRPLRLGYLMTRLKFYQQVQQQARSVAYKLGAYHFAPRTRQITIPATGETIRLTDKEANLLDYLYQAKQPVHRNELLAAVWGYDGDIDTHTLETHIYRLRRAIPGGNELFLVDKGCYQINPSWLVG